MALAFQEPLKFGQREPESKTGVSAPPLPGAWECRAPAPDPRSWCSEQCGALAFWGSHHKFPQIGRLKATGIYSLTVPGARGPYSESPRLVKVPAWSCLLRKAWRRIHSLSHLASGGSRHFLAGGFGTQPSIPAASGLPLPSAPAASLPLPPIRSLEMHDLIISGSLTQSHPQRPFCLLV